MTALMFLLLGCCLGFALGRYYGLRDGEQRAACYQPLALRARFLLQGQCPVCGTSPPLKKED
jgi:hypothetical protein